MKRVVVTCPFIGLISMQVCAVKDATNEEILKVCNDENPSGTTNGWGIVVRSEEDVMSFEEENRKNALPCVCDDDKERIHFIVIC